MTPPAGSPLALLDLKLLQLFDVLYQTRSVTRAAERLGLSQPTVSIWLARLRTMLHDPLFVRTPAGMQPTPRADALIGIAREALEALRRISEWQPEFVPGTARRRFRVCMTDASHVTLLPPLLAHVRAVAPGVALIRHGVSRPVPQCRCSIRISAPLEEHSADGVRPSAGPGSRRHRWNSGPPSAVRRRFG